MVEAIIAARFVHVSGYEEISATDYELFNTLDSSQISFRAENEIIMPGLSITMAIVIFENLHFYSCPRPGCSSERMIMNGSGGRTWYVSVKLHYA